MLGWQGRYGAEIYWYFIVTDKDTMEIAEMVLAKVSGNWLPWWNLLVLRNAVGIEW